MNKTEIVLNKDEFASEYRRIFAENKLDEFITDALCDKFYALTEYMLAQNAVMNLTAIIEPSEVILKHYADSLTVSKYIESGKTVIDVGCGAGFPSLPLAIARPDIQITAIDSTDKRIVYVRECAARLGLDNLTAITARAEDAASGEMRGKYDYATARAVARLNVLAEYCIPLLKVGGVFLPMKAKSGKEEMEEAKNAFDTLHGEVVSLDIFTLVDTKGDGEPQLRMIAEIKKCAPTEKIYPRNNSQIKKKPL
ncbi:MAG: 16S rRNA (guanine(527)-N(7))-methyltransferase RsmG [Ruminococcaceae bacterium]|nr:16S rRNA (guanine(527)-N(7))-methyltransferase RsmG [Oscillospiraceae bacterium]